MAQLDLSRASRQDLLELIAQQQAMIVDLQETVERLQQRVRELEARLSKGGPKGMPGHKVDRPRPKEGKPRKSRQHGFARGRSEPTERVVHVQQQCPHCKVTLVGGWVKRTREVIEVEPTPVKVIEHVYVERRCPLCGNRWVPKVQLEGVVVGRMRLGVKLLSLIATLREEGRLPVRSIQWYLQTFCGLHLSVGGLVAALRKVGELAQVPLEQIRQRIRASPVVHADETGWRQKGNNGYVWTFSTGTDRYFVYGGRGKQMVDLALGEQFEGKLISDFYAAYNHYQGMKQRCWSHLLREVHQLKEMYPEDAQLQQWAKGVHELYLEAKGWSSPRERERMAAKKRFEQRLLELCQPLVEDRKAVQRRLCLRIQRFMPELFVFVAYPEVPSDNNAAERSLRHLVISRKISGGTCSEQGTQTKMTLASVLATWRAQGLNPFTSCLQLLASPQI